MSEPIDGVADRREERRRHQRHALVEPKGEEQQEEHGREEIAFRDQAQGGAQGEAGGEVAGIGAAVKGGEQVLDQTQRIHDVYLNESLGAEVARQVTKI